MRDLAKMAAVTTSVAQMGQRDPLEDPRFAASPLNMPRLTLAPRMRVAVQVALTFFLSAALYAAYVATPTVLDATPWSGIRMPSGTDLPGWVVLVFPILALIPAMYMFTFLKYNFNY